MKKMNSVSEQFKGFTVALAISALVAIALPPVEAAAQPLPDLIVSDLQVLAYTANSIQYQYTIMSVGQAPANLDGPTGSNADNVSVQAFLSADEVFGDPQDQPAGGTILGPSPLGLLNPGESFTGTFGASAAVDLATRPYLTLKVDWGEVVEESDETNNTMAVLIAQHYYLFGQVYSAAQLAPGEDPPNNPLTGRPAEQIVGAEELYAVAPRNLVRVAILQDSTNTPLGDDFLVKYNGGYFLTFRHAGSSLPIRFVVRDAVTGEMLMESGAVTVVAGSNLRFLLVLGETTEIGGTIPFPDPAMGNTLLYTRVGKVEVSEIDSSGFANPSPTAVSTLRIPPYQDAPFGGNLFLFGAFSQGFYPGTGTGLFCYKVFVNDGTSTTQIKDPLYKVKYTVDLVSGSVTAVREQVGPVPQGSVDDCYRLTPMAEPGNVFWSFPDLLMIWRTGTLSGPHTLTVGLYNTLSGDAIPWDDPTAPLTLTTNANSSLLLHLDNEPVIVRFDQIEQQTGGGATETDLLACPCDIVNLAGNRRLFIRFTAHHANGFMERYSLVAISNDPAVGNATWAQAVYSPPPTSFAGTGTVPGDDTVIKQANDPPLTQDCAYIFRLWARARTTDGYHYIKRSSREKAYYVSVPP